MKKYRLKEEAKKYFTEISEEAATLKEFNKLGLTLESLEEVKPKIRVAFNLVTFHKGAKINISGASEEEANIVDFALNELGGSKPKLNELGNKYVSYRLDCYYSEETVHLGFTDWIKKTCDACKRIEELVKLGKDPVEYVYTCNCNVK